VTTDAARCGDKSACDEDGCRILNGAASPISVRSEPTGRYRILAADLSVDEIDRLGFSPNGWAQTV
jgi:hypothetical protein